MRLRDVGVAILVAAILIPAAISFAWLLVLMSQGLYWDW